MSASPGGSGASTPRGGMTPPPPAAGDGPSPLTVGTRFVKQYYKVLTTSPDQIHRFYQPKSVLSHGSGSEPTQPALFEGIVGTDDLRGRFFQDVDPDCQIRFEFEHGAIDAQVSVNGGVLLTVTGHAVYSSGNDGDDDDDDEDSELKRRAFVHTFFLGSMTAGAKRSYYVHNDILRFLKIDDEEKTVIVSNKTTNISTVSVAVSVENENENAEVTKDVVVEKMVTVEEYERRPPVEALSTQPEAPGGGVEETKEPVLADGVHVVGEGGGAGGAAAVKNGSDETKAAAAAAKAVVPGSWASLVSSGGGGSTPATPTRGTPSRPTPASSKPSPAAATPSTPATVSSETPPTTSAATAAKAAGTEPAKAKVSVTSGTQQPRSGRTATHAPRREPDQTLVARNVGQNAKEADVRRLFEPYADKTGAKIVQVSVPVGRTIAFIDYDSPAPVLAALEQHQKEPFQLNGRVLDVYQKTAEQQQRGRRSSSGRGGSTYRGGGVGVGGGGSSTNGNSLRAGVGGATGGQSRRGERGSGRGAGRGGGGGGGR